MKTLIAGAGLAAVLGTAALAQDTPPAVAEGPRGEAPPPGTFAPDAADLLAARMIGVAVYAPEDAAAADGLAAAVEDGAVDVAALEGFVNVGQIADIVLDRQGEALGIVVWMRGLDAALPEAEAPMEAEPAPLPEPGRPQPPEVARAEEVAIERDQVRFLSDANVPDLIVAVVGVPADALRDAPLVDRALMMGGAMVDGGPQPDRMAAQEMPGWQQGRMRMTAPEITLEGFTPMPATEISVEELRGASVFGVEREHVGEVGDIVLDETGAIEYLTVDIGGFLGIGGREVAIGLDEVTVLRDPGRAEVRVHVGATRAMLEDLPEYQRAD